MTVPSIDGKNNTTIIVRYIPEKNIYEGFKEYIDRLSKINNHFTYIWDENK